MPYRQLPKSDSEITKALDAAHKRWLDLAATPAKRIITPAHFTQLDQANAGGTRRLWKKEVGEASTAESHQVTLTTALDPAAATAIQFINHYFIVFDLGVDRKQFQPADRVLYERPANSTSIPLVSAYADIILWGQRITDGEAARQAAATAAGTPFIAMTNPSPAQVAGAVSPFATILGQQDEAQSTTADESRDVADLRPTALGLVRSMWNTIEFQLGEQGLSPSALRTEARLWGVVYINRPGETPDPTPTPTPTPTPMPTPTPTPPPTPTPTPSPT